ncbi:hypothetical protein I4U23_029108 [Adineta vaga]|nr:hypothetical protein I4U23_029108 [Adineta vaga]
MIKFLFIATFFVLLNYATSFDCYDCQNCQIPFNNQANTATCTTGVNQCIKITAKLGTVYTYVAKQCGPCLNETFLFGVTYLKVDCCYGSTCNGTTTLSISKFSIILFLAFLYILNESCFLIYMKKINAAWIILIGFCCLIVIGEVFYLIYRFYINYIYKGKRAWHEITSLSTTKSEKIDRNDSISLTPRASIIPLIQEYLPHHVKKQPKQRKMITKLQFSDPPLNDKNLKLEWDEMNTKSLFSLQMPSTQTLFYTMTDQCDCQESIPDESSRSKFYSITSSDELLTPPSSIEQLLSLENTSHKQLSLRTLLNPLINLSKQLLTNDKSSVKSNLSSNHTILDMEPMEIINMTNDVLQP